MEKVKNFFSEHDHLAKLLGVELIEVGPGTAKARMQITDSLKNGVGTVHGGAIFSLADFVFAVAANSHGQIAVAISASITFMKASSSGFLTAEAREVSKNFKLGTYIVEIRDDVGDIVAMFTGMVYRKKENLPF